MWLFKKNGPSGFCSSSTAEQVTEGIDASGLTAIVTGASSGIGLETARVLAKRGVHVIMAIRNMVAGKEIQQRLVKENPCAKIDAMELDLSSMESVRRFATEFKSSGLPLNILVNNAGLMIPPFTLSKDGIELQFATNYLGHFLLTHLLLDTMKKTARDMKREGRIVNVSSSAHAYPYEEGIRFDKLNDQQGYSRASAYGQSKLANVLHANELARRLKEEGANITANSLHPGVITTNLFRHTGIFEGNLGIFEGVVNAIGRLLLKNVGQGASTTCYLALHPQVNGVTGKYFADNNEDKPNTTHAHLASKLWDFSLQLINK